MTLDNNARNRQNEQKLGTRVKCKYSERAKDSSKYCLNIICRYKYVCIPMAFYVLIFLSSSLISLCDKIRQKIRYRHYIYNLTITDNYLEI